MNIEEIYQGKSHDNILIIGTGPSVFYNMAKIKDYCKQYNPTIIGVNGVLHGLLSIQGKEYQTKDPNGNDILVDCKDIESVIPHILFSFLLRKDKNTVDGVRIKKDKDRLKKDCDLFKAFILKHKKQILEKNISLLCPDNSSRRIVKKRKKYGFKQYGHVKWNYKKSFVFAVHPRGYKGKKSSHPLGKICSVKDIFDKEIKFKAGHGGEYLLAWGLGQKPKTIAIVGICDFPNKIFDRMKRGWFWLDRVREMPPKMSRKQSKLINFIKSYYGNNFHDLNLSQV